MTTHFYPKILFLLVSLFLFGCVTPTPPTQSIKVNAFSAPDASAYKIYQLFPTTQQGKNINTLEYQEYAAYVERMLADKGFTKATSNKNTTVVIFMDYQLSDPITEQYTYSSPVWGQTSVVSSTTYEEAKEPNKPAIRRTVHQPNYGITGYTTNVAAQTVYQSRLMLQAVDAKIYHKNKTLNALWSSESSTVSSHNDLRKLMPFLVVALSPYVGINTQQQITQQIPLDDARLYRIKGGSPLLQP